MTLGEFIAKQELTHPKFAEMVGAHKSTIGRVVSGKGCSRRMARKIEQATAGAVTMAEVLEQQADSAPHRAA